jgi:hypothetical protein
MTKDPELNSSIGRGVGVLHGKVGKIELLTTYFLGDKPYVSSYNGSSERDST